MGRIYTHEHNIFELLTQNATFSIQFWISKPLQNSISIYCIKIKFIFVFITNSLDFWFITICLQIISKVVKDGYAAIVFLVGGTCKLHMAKVRPQLLLYSSNFTFLNFSFIKTQNLWSIFVQKSLKKIFAQN